MPQTLSGISTITSTPVTSDTQFFLIQSNHNIVQQDK